MDLSGFGGRADHAADGSWGFSGWSVVSVAAGVFLFGSGPRGLRAGFNGCGGVFVLHGFGVRLNQSWFVRVDFAGRKYIILLVYLIVML